MGHRIIPFIVFMMITVFMTGSTTSQREPAVPEKKTPEPSPPPKTVDDDISGMRSPEEADEAALIEGNTSEPMEGMQTRLHKTMPLNDTIKVSLKENPTTGYQWNATITSGLMIENNTYVADPVKPGIVGSGGMHYWQVRGIETGNQSFDAVYKRPWETETGNEIRYTIDITVI